VRRRDFARWGLALFYGLAGVLHLILPRPFVSIVPDWVPAPELVVALTGLAEIAGAVGLVQSRSPALRRAAGWGLAAYALCVWPANFKHAIDGIDLPYLSSSWLYHGPRLALQPLIIWWALYCAKVIDWPWRQRGR
jgi:uncharacterized membrane protein